MQIYSSAFENNGMIPTIYTCDGENINPPLNFDDIPENSKSLVLIVDDPDAPVGLWVHWLVWNIDPHILEINEASKIKTGIEGTTSFGNTGYGGPCPPDREHRYFFKLFALDNVLDLSPSSNKSALENAMAGHILGYAELMGRYNRPRN